MTVAESSATTESGWDRRRSRVGSHIERVALELFATHGYANTTVADVADAAGVSARTVARYFPMKDDMLLAFARRMGEDARHGLDALKGSADPIHGVWELWKQQAANNADQMQVMVLWMKALATAPDVGARVPGEQRREVQEVVVQLCAEALGVDPHTDLRPALLAATLMAANEAVCLFWMQSGATADLPGLFDEAREALRTELASLHKRKRKPRSQTA
ncbi:MAG: putative TetR family transcriptional regulator [Frankiales bacterium]|nr:putative TetR family transcriptional regulator [Frankiales bacterium]